MVNLEQLAELFPKGGEVTVADLVEKGAVRKNERVKVLGNGDIQVKLSRGRQGLRLGRAEDRRRGRLGQRSDRSMHPACSSLSGPRV